MERKMRDEFHILTIVEEIRGLAQMMPLFYERLLRLLRQHACYTTLLLKGRVPLSPVHSPRYLTTTCAQTVAYSNHSFVYT